MEVFAERRNQMFDEFNEFFRARRAVSTEAAGHIEDFAPFRRPLPMLFTTM